LPGKKREQKRDGKKKQKKPRSIFSKSPKKGAWIKGGGETAESQKKKQGERRKANWQTTEAPRKKGLRPPKKGGGNQQGLKKKKPKCGRLEGDGKHPKESEETGKPRGATHHWKNAKKIKGNVREWEEVDDCGCPTTKSRKGGSNGNKTMHPINEQERKKKKKSGNWKIAGKSHFGPFYYGKSEREKKKKKGKKK